MGTRSRIRRRREARSGAGDVSRGTERGRGGGRPQGPAGLGPDANTGMFHVKHDRTDTEDRVHVVLYGGVQGVGFRYFTRQAARRLDLAGYVRNRNDGAVELEVSGEQTLLERFLRTVENGPPLAHVERVERLEPGTEALPRPFEVRR